MLSITDWYCYVGFDYHNCFVQVCVLDSNGSILGNQRVVNDVGAIIDYVDNIRDGRLIKGAAVETCCGASNFAEQLLDQEWPIELAHVGICEKMKRSPDKSDFLARNQVGQPRRHLASFVRTGTRNLRIRQCHTHPRRSYH